MKLKEVLAVVNNKGGVGKTTTVQSLAAAITRKDKAARVLCIDLDPQRHLTLLLGHKDGDTTLESETIFTALRQGGSLPVYDTNRERVYVVPGDMMMQEVDSDLVRMMNPKKALAKCFARPMTIHSTDAMPQNIVEAFDYVLIDCAPALSQATYNAMAVATGLLVPVQMEALAVNGLGNIIVALKDVKEELNPNLELRGLLPTMVDARPKIARSFIDYLRRSYKFYVCQTMIRRSVKVNEAQTASQDIYNYCEQNNVAKDYDALVEELFNGNGNVNGK